MSTVLLNTRATQGQRSGSSRDSLVAGEGADAEYGNGWGAEVVCSGALSRGVALTQSAGTCYARREPEHGGTAEAVHPVFNRTLPPALPEALSGASPSHVRYVGIVDITA